MGTEAGLACSSEGPGAGVTPGAGVMWAVSCGIMCHFKAECHLLAQVQAQWSQGGSGDTHVQEGVIREFGPFVTSLHLQKEV